MKRPLLIVLSAVILAGLGVAYAPVEASFVLRRLVAERLVSAKRYELAQIIFASLHRQGDPIGSNNLAAVEYLAPVWPDKETRRRAYFHFRAAANAGLAVAEYNLATLDMPWERSEKAQARLLIHLKKAAELGDELAPLMLREKMGLADRIRVLAKRGDIGAAVDYASMMHHAHKEDEKIWGLRIAAEAGDMEAMADLGWTIIRQPEAKKWLVRAAHAGSSSAAFRMGACHHHAFYFCNRRDGKEAARWYELAIRNRGNAKNIQGNRRLVLPRMAPSGWAI